MRALPASPIEGYVYRILAPGSHSVYVGQSVNPLKRFKQHKKISLKAKPLNPALANFLKKHSDAEIYFWPVLDMSAEEIADEQLCREMGFHILNIAPCGGKPPSAVGNKHNLGRKHTPEWKAMMRAWSTGRKHTPEAIAKMSASHIGKPLSPEHRAKISAVQIGRKATPETIAKMSASRIGKKQSPETIAKRRGKKRSPESIAKMTGRKLSPEHIAKLTGRKLSPETIAKRMGRPRKCLTCGATGHLRKTCVKRNTGGQS